MLVIEIIQQPVHLVSGLRSVNPRGGIRMSGMAAVGDAVGRTFRAAVAARNKHGKDRNKRPYHA
ncbi:hypothetical protein [Tannerella forsythia]|uniref:hypothetical protein n=1 Tax=Tannerella forsythia TaxID=28112 RepID=UPI0028DAFF0D|nr:hypothetical protein [Tannerella forsythia]